MLNIDGTLVKLYKKLDAIAGIFLLLTGILVVFNIMLKVLFGSPIFGTYEIVSFASLFFVSLALANCTYQQGHASVTFLMDKLTQKTKRIIQLIIFPLVFLNLCLIFWAIINHARIKYYLGEASPILKLPMQYIYIILIIGFAFMAISYLSNLRKK